MPITFFPGYFAGNPYKQGHKIIFERRYVCLISHSFYINCGNIYSHQITWPCKICGIFFYCNRPGHLFSFGKI